MEYSAYHQTRATCCRIDLNDRFETWCNFEVGACNARSKSEDRDEQGPDNHGDLSRRGAYYGRKLPRSGRPRVLQRAIVSSIRARLRNPGGMPSRKWHRRL